MSTFDDDDDIRRHESDELHGIAGGWYDKDPTPPHGIERPASDEELANLTGVEA